MGYAAPSTASFSLRWDGNKLLMLLLSMLAFLDAALGQDQPPPYVIFAPTLHSDPTKSVSSSTCAEWWGKATKPQPYVGKADFTAPLGAEMLGLNSELLWAAVRRPELPHIEYEPTSYNERAEMDRFNDVVAALVRGFRADPLGCDISLPLGNGRAPSRYEREAYMRHLALSRLQPWYREASASFDLMDKNIERFDLNLKQIFGAEHICKSPNLDSATISHGRVPHAYVVHGVYKDSEGKEHDYYFTIGFDQFGFEVQTPPTMDARFAAEFYGKVHRLFHKSGLEVAVDIDKFTGMSGGNHFHVDRRLFTKFPQALPNLFKVFENHPKFSGLFFHRTALLHQAIDPKPPGKSLADTLLSMAKRGDTGEAILAHAAKVYGAVHTNAADLRVVPISLVHGNTIELRLRDPGMKVETQMQRSFFISDLMQAVIHPNFPQRMAAWEAAKRQMALPPDGASEAFLRSFCMYVLRDPPSGRKELASAPALIEQRYGAFIKETAAFNSSPRPEFNEVGRQIREAEERARRSSISSNDDSYYWGGE